MTPDRPPLRAAAPVEDAALVEAALIEAALVEEMGRRVRERGVRVAERLAVLGALRDGPAGAERLTRRRDEALERLRETAAALRREAV